MRKLWLIIPIALIGIIGCKEVEKVLWVFGAAWRVQYDSEAESWNNVIMTGDPVPDVDVVTVNNHELEYGAPPFPFLWPQYEDTLPTVIPGNDYELVIEHSWGTAKAKVKCPDAEGFKLTKPVEVEIGNYCEIEIVEGNDLTLEWNEVAAADWYGVVWYIHYSYWLNGSPEQYEFNEAISTTGNKYTISKADLFPANYDSISYQYGYVDIWICNGPEAFTPGTQGNVTGEGSGFWLSFEEGCWLELDLAGPKKFEHKRSSPKERGLQWLELMYKYHK